MGYDMRILGEPTAEEVAGVAAANKAFHDACAVRDALPKPSGTSAWDEKMAKDAAATPGWTARAVDSDGDILIGTPEWVEAQQAVKAAFRAMYDAEPSYFRLNIGGMSVTRQIMEPLGMMHHEFEDAAPAWTEDDPDDEDESIFYRLKREPRLSWAPEVPGICGWKLGSNDGWLVTPVECLGALKRWEEAVDADPELLVRTGGRAGWWMRWLEFLAESAKRGGFLVW